MGADVAADERPRVRWGAFVPHGGAGELAGWSAADAWARARDAATAFDDLGYDHLWTSDHLLASGVDRSTPYFEAYTLLAGLSQVTRRAKLGALVTCALYRSAGMLAKQAAGVDALSGGRLLFALGGGWDEPECQAFGLPFPTPRERVDHFAEVLEACVRLFTEDSVDLAGQHVTLDGAVCNPRPRAKPETWTGTHGPRGLRAAARWADVANWNCDLSEFRRLSGVLDAACAEVGRDPATIGRSVFRLAVLSEDDQPPPELAALGVTPEVFEVLKQQHFLGTPEQVVPQVQEFVDAGAESVVLMFLDAARTDSSAQRWMAEVAPQVRPRVPATAPQGGSA